MKTYNVQDCVHRDSLNLFVLERRDNFGLNLPEILIWVRSSYYLFFSFVQNTSSTSTSSCNIALKQLAKISFKLLFQFRGTDDV